jgi:endonuclease YncB( thermonuclease family)
MASAIDQLRSGLTIGHAQLGMHGGQQGTINQQVHDGDTITAVLEGNVGVRFLGVDAPEVSFTLPGRDGFIRLSNPAWETFLSDPFASGLPPFASPLAPELHAFLATRVGPGAAANHARLGTAATGALRDLVRADVAALGQTQATFRFFCAFAHEVMDGFGRLLCFLNRQQPSATDPAPRPRSYNERMLEAGWVTPYFIWPNIDPFRRRGSLIDAVLAPGTANTVAEQAGALKVARGFVRDARDQHLGLFEQADPLRLLAFELRFLARRTVPERWVIDLGRNDNTLIDPQSYLQVANPEDRLFVPAEYVPLFVEAGWRRPQ